MFTMIYPEFKQTGAPNAVFSRAEIDPKASANGRRRGFALVIALGLMSFVLLLLLGLTAFVRVESQNSSIAMGQLQAKQNALLGGMIALGELQKQMGPDQRATASASVLADAPDKSLWTGVLRTVNPDNPDWSRREVWEWATDPERIEWLFSRETGRSVPLASDLSGDSGFVPLVRYTQADLSLPDLLAYGQKRPAETGFFAWWIGDENQKAGISGQPVRPQSLSQEQWRRLQFATPVRADLRALDTEWMEKDELGPDALPESLISSRQFDLLTTESNADRILPHISTISESIPVDVVQGRLKQDLSAYLAGLDATITDDTPVIRGHSADSDYRGPQLALNADAEDIPRFGTIRDWASLASEELPKPRGGRPENRRQHFAPFLLRLALYYRPSLDYGAQLTPATGENPAIYAPAGLDWHLLPAFLIWNPYDRQITASDYLIQMNGNLQFVLRSHHEHGIQHFRSDTSDANQMRLTEYEMSRTSPGDPGQIYVARSNTDPDTVVRSFNLYAILEEDPDDQLQVDSSPPSTVRWMNFVVQDLTLEPGEVRILMPGVARPYRNENASFYFDPANRSQGNILLPDVYQDNSFTLNTGMSVRKIDNLSEGPPPTGLHGYFWSRKATDSTQLAASRLRLWALDAADGPEIVQDASTLNLDGNVLSRLDNFGGLLEAQLQSSSQTRLLHGVEGNLSHPIIGTNQFSEYNERYYRVMGASIRGLARPSEPAMQDLRLLANMNPFAATVGSSLADVGITRKMGSLNMLFSFPAGHWFVNGPGWAAGRNNRYGNWTYPVLLDHHGSIAWQASNDGLLDYAVQHLPAVDVPVSSLGQLQNVSLSKHFWQPLKPMGNSLPPAFAPRDQAFDPALQGQDAADRDPLSRSRAAIDAPNALLDMSYALNSSLWDRFYLSTLPYSEDFDFDEQTQLPYAPHHIGASSIGLPDWADLLSGTRAFEESAAHIRVKGGFNVNSISVSAWKLFLGASLGQTVPTRFGGDLSNGDDRFPFPRTADVLLPEQSGGSHFTPADFMSIRSLGEAELQALAEAIVDEVKSRGPFLSLADFVNRSLLARDNDPQNHGLTGAIQAAIDRVTREQGLLNHEFYTGDRNQTFKTVQESSLNYTMKQSLDGSAGGERLERLENLHGGVPAGQKSSAYRGGPRYLMQSDLLSSLGPMLTVRGDTFVIRSYGESSATRTPGKASRVYLEMTVQRVAEPVEDATGVAPVRAQGDFGRRFIVTGMRWVSPNEI